jgi:hypothetical protein
MVQLVGQELRDEEVCGSIPKLNPLRASFCRANNTTTTGFGAIGSIQDCKSCDGDSNSSGQKRKHAFTTANRVRFPEDSFEWQASLKSCRQKRSNEQAINKRLCVLSVMVHFAILFESVFNREYRLERCMRESWFDSNRTPLVYLVCTL